MKIGLQQKSPAHNEIIKYGEFQAQLNGNNLYTDYEGHYWVAIGPNFMNPNHPKERVDYDLRASEMNYGTKLISWLKIKMEVYIFQQWLEMPKSIHILTAYIKQESHLIGKGRMV